ncbi:MAG: SRPBCC family protein [Bacteroidia bacterium]
MSKRISLEASIEMAVSPERVYDYVSDLRHDHAWRAEVERMDVSGGCAVGCVVTEYIRIYRFFQIITPVEIIRMDRPHAFEIETQASHPTWVHCLRKIERCENGRTKLSVRLSFTLDNLKQIFPFEPPAVFVRMWYKPRMRRYLEKLKDGLEKEKEKQKE